MAERVIKLLCVDDEKNVLRALTRIFLDENWDILTAESGEEGLTMLANEQPVQVVISDYRMPGMNGVDFLKQVHEQWPETIRIVLSGYADTAAVVEAINEGKIYKFIAKPWNDDELKNTITKAIELFFLAEQNRELTERLQHTVEELQLMNESLESVVNERTEELVFQNRVLQSSQNILDLLPAAVMGFDSELTIVQSNQAANRFFIGGRAAPVGSNAVDVLPVAWVDFLKQIRSNDGESKQLVIRGETPLILQGAHARFPSGQECIILVLLPSVNA